MADERSKNAIKLIKTSQVVWTGPNSRKGKGYNNGGTSGSDPHKPSDEESQGEGSYEVGEGSQTILFERKRRTCCEGDYPRKPTWNARPTVQLLRNLKGFMGNTPKKTLARLARLKWDEHTISTKGAARNAWYNRCINCFKEYYIYPKGILEEDGDGAVRAHLNRNFKSYLGTERARLLKKLNVLFECGYTEEELDIKGEAFKPHYFSQRAWNSICAYWGTPEFKKLSDAGKNAREKMEFTSRTGAKPYEQRRQEIDEVRIAKGEMPISDEEFINTVYDPTEPAVIELQGKLKKVRVELADELEAADEGASPRTQRAIQRKNNLIVLAGARPPTKGRVNLFPQDTLAELMGAQDAMKLLKKRKMKDSDESFDVAPEEIYSMMPTILEEVKQMVRSLPMEVMRSVLDEKVSNLATAAFPDPSQRSKHKNYVRTASVALKGILKDNDKIIVQETLLGKALVVHNTSNNGNKDAVGGDNEDGVGGEYEDEDLDAHNYPLL